METPRPGHYREARRAQIAEHYTQSLQEGLDLDRRVGFTGSVSIERGGDYRLTITPFTNSTVYTIERVDNMVRYRGIMVTFVDNDGVAVNGNFHYDLEGLLPMQTEEDDDLLAPVVNPDEYLRYPLNTLGAVSGVANLVEDFLAYYKPSLT